MNFKEVTQSTGTDAKSLMDSIVKFYLDENLIDQTDYIVYKKKIDSMNISSMMLQLKTAQHAITKLLEEIDLGMANPRMFEVLAQLQSQIMQMPKDYQNYMEKMEESYRRAGQDLEKKVASIKNSETAKKVKDSWDNLWVDVKDSAADAQTQLKILLLKQKIDAAARKVTPAGQTMNFVDCTGWNTLGCKSDSIKKVQNCMDIGVSGNFDEFLKSELARYKSTYAFREGFSDSDVQKICAYKQEENRQEALKREQLAKQAQKAAEIQAFERKYPQVFTPATERDEF
jgi:predicted GIY-YIG superfamily endonuclease